MADNAKFCPDCGLQVEQPAAAPVQEVSVPGEPVQYTQPTQGEYAPPAQGSYAPPAQPTQGGYTPPTQGGYAPPTQGGYTLPTQGGYAPPAQGGFTPAKAKKPVNKKIFLFGGVAVALIAVVVLIVSLLGGGDKAGSASTDPNIGVWNVATAEMRGYEIKVSDVYKDGFSIELKPKGKCAVNVDGEKRNIKWTIEGDKINIKGSGLDMDGTLKNGLMTFEDVMGTGVTLTFKKEGAAGNAAKADPNSTEPGSASAADAGTKGTDTGLYTAVAAEYNGTKIEVENMFAGGISVELQEGGKCIVGVGDLKTNGEWSLVGGVLHVESDRVLNSDGTLKDGVMVLEDAIAPGIKLTLVKDSANTGSGSSSAESEDTGSEDIAQTSGGATESGGATDVSYALVDSTLSLTLPSGDWIDKGTTGGASGGVTTASFYYKESHANAPRVTIQESFSGTFEDYKDRWENYADIGSKTIAGINLEGRTYTAYKMQWIDYIGELGDKYVCITIIDLDPESGETKALLDSIAFH